MTSGHDDYLKLLSAAAPVSETLDARLTGIILEQRARLADGKVNDELIKSLVLRYAHAEVELKKLDELKNKFLGMAAHDLRNPLTSIRGFSSLLLEGGLDENSQKEFLQIINNVSEEMLVVLNDLLDISQIESGKFDLHVKEGDLAAVVKTRVHLNSVIAARKEISIESDIESPLNCRFDHERIGQVLDNLMSNAIKFSPPGSKVKVSLRRDGAMARAEVADSGPGISPEDQAKLFGEFQKLSAKSTAGEKSTGLGLAIVKKIVAAHGGQIGVRSEVGRGSAFYFSLKAD